MFCSLSVLNGYKGIRRPECEADIYRPLVLRLGMCGARTPFSLRLHRVVHILVVYAV
jgi:hypothetical protein